MNKFNKLLMVFYIMLFSFVINSGTVQAQKIDHTDHENLTYEKEGEEKSGQYYYVNGNGVRFRSSPYINNNNIICTLYSGASIFIQSGSLNVGYHDGYYWAYGRLDPDHIYGYIANNYLN